MQDNVVIGHSENYMHHVGMLSVVPCIRFVLCATAED